MILYLVPNNEARNAELNRQVVYLLVVNRSAAESWSQQGFRCQEFRGERAIRSLTV